MRKKTKNSQKKFETYIKPIANAVIFSFLIFNTISLNAQELLDHFNLWENNGGSDNWASNWIETDGGSSAMVESIQVRSDYTVWSTSVYKESLKIGPDLVGYNIYRDVNLCNATSVTLSYDYNCVSNKNEEYLMQISTDAGSTWTTLFTHKKGTNAGQGTKSIDISSYTSCTNSTRIRFYVNATDNKATYYFDNVNISYTSSAGVSENVFDDFNHYSVNAGTDYFTSDWQESGSSFRVWNDNCPSGECLEISSDELGVGNYIYREMDLCAASAAVITYDYNSDLLNGDKVDIEISDDGGTTWTLLKSLTGTDDTGILISGSEEISFAVDPTSCSYQVRFITSNYVSGGMMYLDNFKVAFTLIPKLDFDGTDDYVDFGDNHDLTSSFSLEAWVLQETTVTTGTIISKRNVKSGNLRGYHLALNNSFPNLTWYNSSGTAVINITSPYAITNNRWYHIAATYDGTTAKIYIDGIMVKEGTGSSAPVDGTENFLIGAMYDSDTPTFPKNYFNGFIDEVRVWNTALTEQQLHEMMNQEIEVSGTAVRGKTIPIDISGGLLWSDLKGYYPMNDDTSDDQSSNGKNGTPKNITTIELQTAPLPYTTTRIGSWDDTTSTTPWLYGDTVWDAPNSTGVDGATKIDWNIVTTDHNVNTTRYVTVLGLKNNTNELSVNADNSLTVSHYLKVDGVIDLDGESQLIQTEGSTLDENSTGYLERDQQGTASSYNYNYWSSPVSPQASGPGTNNTSYTIANVLRDGTNPSNPLSINFQPSAYAADNAGTNPITLSTYWMYRFNGPSDDYNSWIHVGSAGALKTGEGFTLKGVDGTKAITDTQNYVFKGKPNNGTITLALDAGKDCLIGNPYASAIDAIEFINDNLSTASGGNSTVDVFNGALYFWDHFATKTHLLKGYVGGYGTLNKIGGVKAVSNDERINANGSESNRRPGQYIPVTQGFFVVAEDGGTITFKNSQRIFEKEVAEVSVFLKSEQTKNTNKSNNYDLKIWLNFDLPSGYHRQLLIGEAEGTTNNYDTGFDAPLIENNADDAYWYFDNDKYVIQGVPLIDNTQEFLIGIKAGQTGLLRVNLDDIQNDFDNIDIYIKDNTTGELFDIKYGIFETVLEAGEYNDRFSIVFEDQTALSVDDGFELQNELINVYVNQEDSMLTINRTNEVTINNVAIYNTLGQLIHSWNSNFDKNTIQLPVKLTKGVYIAIVKTNNKQYSKKILIQN